MKLPRPRFLLALLALLSISCTANLLSSRAQAPASPPVPETPTTATDIPGVVAAGTKVERIWTGNQSADGIVGAKDGSLLFTEQAANRVSKIDQNGKVSLVVEDANGPGALAIDYKGRVIAVERTMPRLAVLTPAPMTLSDRPPIATSMDDLAVDKKGGVYFTEARKPPTNNAIYYLKPDGKIILVTDEVARANGVLLSPDEKIAYVTDTPADYIVAFDVNPDGSLTNRRNFGDLIGRGGDGLAIDAAGRLYIACNVAASGVIVLSPEGKLLGRIPMPRGTTSVAFAGPDKKTLYIVGRGNDGPDGNGRWSRTMYKVSMLAQGFAGRAK